jgi:hypothetical protein
MEEELSASNGAGLAGPEALEHAVAAVTAIARSEAVEGPGKLPRLPDLL